MTSTPDTQVDPHWILAGVSRLQVWPGRLSWTINFLGPSLTDDSQCQGRARIFDILVHNSWTVMLVLSVSSNWGRNSVLTETLLDKIQTRRKEQKLLWWSNIAGLIVTKVLLSFISLFLTWPVSGYQEVGGLSAGTRLTPRTPVSVHGCQGRPGLGSGQFQ